MVNETAITAWALRVMLGWVSPPSTEAEMERLRGIARDAAVVAFDETEKPVFPGAQGRLKTLSLMLGIASYESDGFLAVTDSGERRGDSGSSWCLMQIHLPGGVKISPKGQFYQYGVGWTGRDLVNDRQKCFRMGLHIARESIQACKNLSVYSSGKCRRDDSEPKARERYARAKLVWRSMREEDSEFES